MELIRTHDMVELCINGEVLKAKFDASGNVCGCMLECFGDCSSIKCVTCSWEGCTMRGLRKE